MRKRTVGFVVVMLLALASCRSYDPVETYSNASLTYRSALATANELRENERISKEEFSKIRKASLPARYALDQWHEALEEDRGTNEIAKEAIIAVEELRKELYEQHTDSNRTDGGEGRSADDN